MGLYERCVDASCREYENKHFYPPSRIQLGRAGWLLLHSIANNTDVTKERLELTSWLYSFAALYPCHVCRDSLYEIYRANPPNLSTQDEFILWTCKIHNKVNEELSKPVRCCDVAELRSIYARKPQNN